MRTLTVKFTELQVGEIAHKLTIVRDEPDLLESYELTHDDASFIAELFLRAAPGIITFDERFADVIVEELDDRCNSCLSNWKDCGDETEGGCYRSLRAAINLVRLAQAACNVPMHDNNRPFELSKPRTLRPGEEDC